MGMVLEPTADEEFQEEAYRRFNEDGVVGD